MNKVLTVLLLCLFTTIVNAQEQSNKSDTIQDSVLRDAPKVFLDCFYCDIVYMKQNVPFLNYVRDRKVADVHVLGTRIETGAGGWEESFEFIGQKRFTGMNDTLRVIIEPNATSDEKRQQETAIFKMGMMRYAAKTEIAQLFTIEFSQPVDQTDVEDKWNNWVFELGGNGSMQGSDVQKNTSFWTYINARKVTPEFRFNLDLRADYFETQTTLSEYTFRSILKGQDFGSELVWSLSDHWSAGLFTQGRTSVFNNYAFTYNVTPAIEYNIYPYSVSAKKQLRISYMAGAGHNWYNDTTIFNKDFEFLGSHGLNMSYRVREQWGNVNFSLWSNQYFHNLNLYSFGAWTSLNLRLAKGFNFNMSGNFGVTQDQISLSKEGLSDEELLANQGQRATNYTYYLGVGINYTFGSIFNSVVNPRFG